MRVKWMGHVISMDGKRDVCGVLVETFRERNCLAGKGMNEKVLGWMLVGGCEMDPSG
jgi:hypothetical protein